MESDTSDYDRKEFYYDRYASFFDGIMDVRYGGDGEDVYGDKDLQTETEFYVEQAMQVDGPVLEIGCGTGRVYLELLREGVDAYGIDISERMLGELERRAESEPIEPQVRRAEMQTFTPRREYEAVIIPGRGFRHNVSREDQKRTLENIHDALAPGGKLICNFYTPDFDVIADYVGEAVEEEFDHDGETFTVSFRRDFDDKVHNVVHCVQTFKDADGNIVDEISTRVKLIMRDEFALLLETAGFDGWEVYGGFDMEPHDSVEQEMVWIATA